eukprot:1589503-Rhodomonas_salina.1
MKVLTPFTWLRHTPTSGASVVGYARHTTTSVVACTPFFLLHQYQGLQDALFILQQYLAAQHDTLDRALRFTHLVVPSSDARVDRVGHAYLAAQHSPRQYRTSFECNGGIHRIQRSHTSIAYSECKGSIARMHARSIPRLQHTGRSCRSAP